MLETFYDIVYATAFLIVFITACSALKPLRSHRRRKYSTYSLKFTYLAYLACYLFFLYFLMFSHDTKMASDNLSDSWLKFYMVVFLLISLLPNLGIILRRKIRRSRNQYNLIFSSINALTAVAIIILTSNDKWGIFHH